MQFHSIIESLFSGKTKTAVLTLLLRYPAKKFSGREVARLVKAAPSSVLTYLEQLKSYGVIHKNRIGKTTQWQLNAEHWLANKLTPLILLDALAQADLLNRIKKSLGQNRRIIKAFLFGSLAKKTETPDSDIDLLIIVKSAVDKQNVESAINQLNDRLIRFYGNTISPVIYTQKEYSAKKTSSLINQIKEDQIILVNHA